MTLITDVELSDREFFETSELLNELESQLTPFDKIDFLGGMKTHHVVGNPLSVAEMEILKAFIIQAFRGCDEQEIPFITRSLPRQFSKFFEALVTKIVNCIESTFNIVIIHLPERCHWKRLKRNLGKVKAGTDAHTDRSFYISEYKDCHTINPEIDDFMNVWIPVVPTESDTVSTLCFGAEGKDQFRKENTNYCAVFGADEPHGGTMHHASCPRISIDLRVKVVNHKKL